ncbi:beta strand repeat-containing protein [Rariglobus hedericola]|uniref:beta strand repeat-containing protein n=1 Tax=Rariglobus hedericola TaxID=2597822 RepID=UPI0039EC1BC9
MPVAQAASFYWDSDATGSGNDAIAGTGLGSTGNWNNSLSGTPLVNWWSGSGTTDQTWVNAGNNTAVFSGTAGTVSLTDNITAGGLLFNTTGYTINTGANTLTFATGSTITLNNIAAAAITGNVSGSGAVTLTRSTGTAGILTLNGTSTGGWSGATTLSNGAGLTLSGSNQALLNTSGIDLGGNITLVNTSLAEAGLNRISDTAAITSTGGTFTVTNTVAAATPYAETVGAVGVTSGKLNVVSTNANTGGTQVLTLGGLTQSGTGTVAFSAGGGLNTSTNRINVTGATQTPAGQIIGPWASIGLSATNQTNYAAYDAAGNIVSAGITGSAETTWTTPANTYGVTGGTTLTANRSVNALLATGGAQTLALNGFNLDTNGIMNGGTGLLTISGTGSIRQQGTAAGNLYINAGSGSGTITISSIIANNTGALSLVKSGSGTVTITGANTFTGDTIVQEGTLLVSGTTVTRGNIFVGSLGGGAAAVYGASNTNTWFNGSNTTNATVYSNGTLNIVNVPGGHLNNLTVIGGTVASAFGWVSGAINMTGGSITGNLFGLNSAVTTNASSATALISANVSTNFNSFTIADGEAAIDLNVTGVKSQSSLTKLGAGVMALSGANTFSGTTTVSAGTLLLRNSLALQNSPVITGGTGIAFDSSVSSRAFTFGGLAGSTNLSLLDNAANAVALTLKVGSTARSYSGVLSGAGSLTKSGTGVQTLTGLNTYTGGTNVTAGTLVYGNSFTMSGINTVTVAAAGVAGTDYATVGSTAGTLTFGGTLGINVTASLSGGESFTLFSKSGSGALAGDFGNTAGNVSITGTYAASLTNDGSGIWTGTDTNGSGLSFTFSASGLNAGLLTVSAVPEPSTYAAICGVLALAGATLQRRRSVRR